MLKLIRKIDRDDLWYAIADKIELLDELLEGEPVGSAIDIDKLSKYILAIYGYDILYESKIRHLIFMLIEDSRLKQLAQKYAKKSYNKPYDNALSLSLCPWKSGSDFVITIARELNIPKDYLPLKTNSNQVVEFIEPIDKLFDLHNYQIDLKKK